MERQPPVVQSPLPTVAISRIGSSGCPRREDLSAAAISPIAISFTRSKPCVITSMLEFTTASPSLPNFFTYCFITTSRYCSCVMPNSCSMGRDGEEGAEEGVALHAELKVGAVSCLAGDFKARQREDANVLLDDLLARPERQVLPRVFAFFVRLPDETAALLACRRAGWCG